MKTAQCPTQPHYITHVSSTLVTVHKMLNDPINMISGFYCVVRSFEKPPLVSFPPPPTQKDCCISPQSLQNLFKSCGFFFSITKEIRCNYQLIFSYSLLLLIPLQFRKLSITIYYPTLVLIGSSSNLLDNITAKTLMNVFKPRIL